MATFNLLVGGPKGAELTKKADGIVLMGALVVKGTASGDVKEATSATEVPYAVALVDERIARENESAGASVFQYADNQQARIMTLCDGQVLNLKAVGSVSENETVIAHSDGSVATGTGNLVVGRALEAITDGSRGQVVIQLAARTT
jgi:hypothetical protein